MAHDEYGRLIVAERGGFTLFFSDAVESYHISKYHGNNVAMICAFDGGPPNPSHHHKVSKAIFDMIVRGQYLSASAFYDRTDRFLIDVDMDELIPPPPKPERKMMSRKKAIKKLRAITWRGDHDYA